MSAATTPRPFTVYAVVVVGAAILGCLVLVSTVPEHRAGPFDLVALAPAVVALPVLLGALGRRGAADSVTTADTVTVVRAVLVAVVAGWAVLVALGSLPATSWWLLGLALVALLLDGVDGAVARRTQTTSEVGAMLDAETDAAMMMALSVIAAHQVGVWILLAGGLRYVFAAVETVRWTPPTGQRPVLPDRPSRRVIAALAAVALAVTVAPGLAPLITIALCAVALSLLLVSFGLDAISLEGGAGRRVVGDVVGRSTLQGGVDASDVLTQDPEAQELHSSDRRDDHHR